MHPLHRTGALVRSACLLAVSAAAAIGCGGGSSGGASASPPPTPPPTATACDACHATSASNGFHAGQSVDSAEASPTYYDPLAGAGITEAVAASVHASSTSSQAATCESCHGDSTEHATDGSVLTPSGAPGVSECGACHASPGFDLAAFGATAHANPSGWPDRYYFQSGSGNTQATYRGESEWKDAAGTVPVTEYEHVQQCSVCHAYAFAPGIIEPGALPDPPQVGCGACHDSHRPSDGVRNFASSRGAAGGEAAVPPATVLNLKPQRVVNEPASPLFGANDAMGGTWIRPRLHYDWHVGGDPARTYAGYAAQDSASGDSVTVNGVAVPLGKDALRLSPERLCAACHAKGKYAYLVAAGPAGAPAPVAATHQDDVYGQYGGSAHAATVLAEDGSQAAFWAFSLLATVGSAHRPRYPIDMGAKPGAADRLGFDGRMNGGPNDFSCDQCHHGIGAIDYMNAVQGGVALGDSQAAHVLWGDAPVTCITCHDPHRDAPGATRAVRVPRRMSYNDEFLPSRAPSGGDARGGAVAMMDLTPVPDGIGNDAVCIFCHQGSESGWTTWNKVRRARLAAGDTASAAADFWYASPAVPVQAGQFGLVSSHGFGAGALLYSRNLTEALSRSYSDGNVQHQQKGCTGCHMAAADAAGGGHTWRPQLAVCQQCHAGLADVHAVLAPADLDGDGTRGTAFQEIGTVDLIPRNGQPGFPGHGASVYATGKGGTGLMGLLNEALWDAGIELDGAAPFYFVAGSAHGPSDGYESWSPNQLAAAQNLLQLHRSGRAGRQAIDVHNTYYAAQILVDSLAALGKTSGRGGPFQRPTTSVAGTTHAGRDYRLLSPP